MARPDSFEEFEATSLFCPRCRRATPARKKLLLVLPSGNKYDYVCAECGTTVGGKTDNDARAFHDSSRTPAPFPVIRELGHSLTPRQISLAGSGVSQLTPRVVVIDVISTSCCRTLRTLAYSLDFIPSYPSLAHQNARSSERRFRG